ncbi:ribosomal-processing cysteine protease Prp [Heliorestis acidaminivorans]|uniref:Ribosomal processing cysteine protease Prp n=1 Tax=Heliorestis acidaminivorans TaxID=553427 RepID=A0A6I0F4X6_9FIRM|nr:ribosomal-processing cysteine protease Prp [Heliorestis acidaminivorans]KAB2952327.1 ribosomal-processing cysteine protease Prp [Heliorestis acidaminivorans]
MVKTVIFIDDAGTILGFETKGHAGSAPAGQDVVCAGVSALTFTAVNGLEHFLGATATEVEAPEPGELRCILKIPLNQNDSKVAQIILETMLLGLEQIQEAYPAYVKVQKRRCVPC